VYREVEALDVAADGYSLTGFSIVTALQKPPSGASASW